MYVSRGREEKIPGNICQNILTIAKTSLTIVFWHWGGGTGEVHISEGLSSANVYIFIISEFSRKCLKQWSVFKKGSWKLGRVWQMFDCSTETDVLRSPVYLEFRLISLLTDP